MEDVKIVDKGDKFVIEIAKLPQGTKSVSGKNTLYASTRGSRPVVLDGAVAQLSINLYG